MVLLPFSEMDRTSALFEKVLRGLQPICVAGDINLHDPQKY